MILNSKATLTNGKPTAAPGSEAPDAGQAGSARQAGVGNPEEMRPLKKQMATVV